MLTASRMVLLMVAATLLAAYGGSAAQHGVPAATAAAKPPRVVAIATTSKNWQLMLLDARTLKTVRPGWSRAVPRGVPAARSPAGSRLAIGLGRKVHVLDTATGRTLDDDAVTGSDLGLYWLGGEGTRGTRVPLIVTTFTSSKGDELQVVGEAQSTVSNVPVLAVLRDGLVLAPDATPNLLVVWPDESLIELPQLPGDAPFRVVADVGRDRLYVISSAGMVATIGKASSAKPVVAYHDAPLNGGDFDAAWAGGGKIALWGEDGLGTIDVRTWTTHAIAPGVTGALATRYGIAAWTKTADGIAVYKPDGTRKFELLPGKEIRAATAVGTYLYADTTGKTRYAIDLRTSKTTGPLPTSTRIVTPSYVVIP